MKFIKNISFKSLIINMPLSVFAVNGNVDFGEKRWRPIFYPAEFNILIFKLREKKLSSEVLSKRAEYLVGEKIDLK